MKRIFIAIFALASTLANAQTVSAPVQTSDVYGHISNPIADCRNADLHPGDLCEFRDSSLPVQKVIGKIHFDNPQGDANMTEPVPPTGVSVIRPASVRRTFTVGGMYGIQSETPNYTRLVSDMVKVYGYTGITKYLGAEARFTRVDAYIAEIGHYAGQNHTTAFSVGPILSTNVKFIRPYFTAQVGSIYQKYYGVTVGGAAGVDVKLTHHLSWRALDGEYRYAVAMPSYHNPRRGRIEFGTGLGYRF